MMNKNIFIALLLILVSRLGAENVYDSLAWYDDTHISFARTRNNNYVTEHVFYPNGHVCSIKRTQGNSLLSLTEYYENGNKKFDTVCSANYYNWSNRYYPDGSKQRFIQEQFESSYKSSHTRFEIIDWDVNGEVSHVFIKDDRNNVVANETYPFRQFSNIALHEYYYDNGILKESGLYVPEPFTGRKIKYGAWITYHPDGQVQSIGLFMKDIPWGLHYTFDTAGVQTSLKNYVMGTEVKPEQNELKLVPTNWKEGADSVWQWRGFTQEGLVLQSNGPTYYFYRGCIIAGIRSMSKQMKNILNQENYSLPFMAFWSTWNKYSVTFTGNVITRETEEIDGSWSTVRQFTADGKLTESSMSSRNEHITWNPNGLMRTKEHPLYYGFEPTWYIEISRIYMKQDTTFHWDNSGRLTRIDVYGLYGQLYKSVYRALLSEDSVVINPMYTHVYVEPEKGKRIEILDNDVLLPGYVYAENEKRNPVVEGQFVHRRTGKWITYNPESGRILRVENFCSDGWNCSGKFREYYENGNPKTTGRYNKDHEKAGVWKTYDSKGRVRTRIRYCDGEIRGLEYCRLCCPNRYGRYRMRFTLHLGNRQISFPKCNWRRRPVPF